MVGQTRKVAYDTRVNSLSKPERRLLQVAVTKGRIYRRSNNPHPFDTLLKNGMIDNDGHPTRKGHETVRVMQDMPEETSQVAC